MYELPENATVLLVSVNNTRTRVGLARKHEIIQSRSVANADADAAAAEIRSVTAAEPPAFALLASVNDTVAGPLALSLRDALPNVELYRLGRDLAIPMPLAVDEPEGVGVDRRLTALAAFRRAGQACAVVDVGTAVTVDFVDGQGTFQGGAIAPGLALMLDALQRRTERLPDIAFEAPDPAHGPFGLTTIHAMRLGVAAAVRGLVRERVEAYAESFGAFPVVVATGGDMGVLEGDGLIEHFVPDLMLQGMLLAAEHALDEDDDLDL